MGTVFQKYPKEKRAFINPEDFTKQNPDFPELCVSTFSNRIIDKFASLNNVKVIDFGLADTFYGKKLKHNVGTPGYTAPEVLMGVRWGPECDVWSLGCLLIELALGRIEFDACDDLVHLFQIQHMIGTLPKWMVEECPKEKLCKAFTGGLLRPDAIADEEARKAALEKPPLLDMLSSDDVLADLAMRMLEPDPFERYKIEDVLEHPFFNACK